MSAREHLSWWWNQAGLVDPSEFDDEVLQVQNCTFEIHAGKGSASLNRLKSAARWAAAFLQPALHCVKCQTDWWSLLEPRPTHLYPDKCRDWSWVHFLAVATLSASPVIAAGVQDHIWTTSSQANWVMRLTFHFNVTSARFWRVLTLSLFPFIGAQIEDIDSRLRSKVATHCSPPNIHIIASH